MAIGSGGRFDGGGRVISYVWLNSGGHFGIGVRITRRKLMQLGLGGKRAVVTGGSRGIGRAIALELAREGAEVCITYRDNDEAAQEALALLREAAARGLAGDAAQKAGAGDAVARACAGDTAARDSAGDAVAQASGDAGACGCDGGAARDSAGAPAPRFMALKGDAADEGFAKEVASKMKEIYGGVDILVNNAGITGDGLLVRMKSESFDKVVATNLNGAFYMLRELSIIMLKQREGRIVNISSVSGIKGNAGQANYSASKAGLIGLTKAAAKELGGKGITVNAVAPGLIDTDMAKGLSEAQLAGIIPSIAAGRLGKPDEVAALVCFLCSAHAAYITGQVVAIDGGLIM